MSLGFVQSRTLRGDAVRSAAVAPGRMQRNVPEGPVVLDAETSYARLRRWNVAMALFHTAFAVVTLTAGNVNLSIELYGTEITFVDNVNRTDPNAPSFLLVPSYRKMAPPLPLTVAEAPARAALRAAAAGRGRRRRGARARPGQVPSPRM
mgnify:CR=1 FL=1